MNDRVAFILDALDDQEPLLFLVAGEVWEGHMQSCVEGAVVAVVRQAGATHPYGERRWRLEDIADMARREPEGDDDEEDDGLFAQARRMTELARDYGEMSLAERLLKDRAMREEHE